jgi:AraC-like DNA-binding protein
LTVANAAADAVPADPAAFRAGFFARHPLAEQAMSLFDNVPDVVFYAKDTAGRFVRVNRRFLDNHGLQREEQVLGRTDRDLSVPAMAAAYMAEDRRVMDARRALPGQVWLVYHERRVPRWYVSSKTPLFDPAGEVVGLAGAMYPVDRPDDLARHVEELLPVVRHIERHYADTVSMSQMAKLAGLSATHFNRRFRQLLRMTPVEYLRTVRVQAARQRLAGTSDPLVTIAADTGFADQSHFTRRFRQTTGVTPAAYRRRYAAGTGS